MALATTQTGIVIERQRFGRELAREMSFWDKLVLQNAHPAKMAFNVMGIIWALYYAWYNVAALAVIAGVVFLVLGSVIVSLDDPRKFSDTMRGQMVMAMNNPVSIVLELLGYGVLFYAVWVHSGVLVLCAVSTFALSRAYAGIKAFGR